MACLVVPTTSMPALAATASLSGAIVVDPLSGVAMGGYDPVSYFTEEEPAAGRPEFEYDWRGVPWYFANAANRDVFVRSPESYAPQFGGYGLMGLARGYLSEGNPRVFEILAGRLFLFYSSSNKDAFLLSQKASYESARRNWELLAPTLSAAGK
ncbi:YHS domain-containing (seleno)protein [Mariluticola halotolerans]|uniref:YHS domain-containing (seleno)protein n=1 Tax=Mariluticola halotolerans TaxID=2909283 RepID=UPI0026E16393|nr:YHS domain-containing (seleno)protein [Mariluticola halotolerans]UJQ94087.1 hypothetical protein L1P08_14145 [Mariluticola halotolerans]